MNLYENCDFADARQQILDFLDAFYNVNRIHSALGYLTPVDIEAQWRNACAETTTSRILAKDRATAGTDPNADSLAKIWWGGGMAPPSSTRDWHEAIDPPASLVADGAPGKQ